MPRCLRNDQYIKTGQRLRSYGVLSESVIELVAQFAAKQAEYETYQDFFVDMGVGEPFLHVASDGSGVPVVDVAARATNEQGVLVIHAPMEMALNQAQLYLIATLAGVYPEYRIIGFGNPSGDRFYHKEHNLTFWRRLKLLMTNNQRGLVAAELDYLQGQGVERMHHVGFSYGSLKAVLEAEYLPEGSVETVTLIDPVARPRSIFRLARDFANTYGPLGKYVNQVGLETYHKARGDAAKDRNHRKALLRPINVTIAFLLARIDIFKRLRRMIVRQPQAVVTVAWGTASELGDDKATRSRMAGINADQPEAYRIQQLPLLNLEHALANDVHLYAAITGQGIMRR